MARVRLEIRGPTRPCPAAPHEPPPPLRGGGIRSELSRSVHGFVGGEGQELDEVAGRDEAAEQVGRIGEPVVAPSLRGGVAFLGQYALYEWPIDRAAVI